MYHLNREYGFIGKYLGVLGNVVLSESGLRKITHRFAGHIELERGWVSRWHLIVLSCICTERDPTILAIYCTGTCVAHYQFLGSRVQEVRSCP